MSEKKSPAPGHPGIEAKWTSSSKQGIGCAIQTNNRLTFTLSHGILNEIYYPQKDNACTRDMGFLVADGEHFFSEEKRNTDTDVGMIEPGIPAYRIVNTCQEGKYKIEKTILVDPLRDCLLQQVRFTNLSDQPLSIYALLAPHINNKGGGNTAWLGKYKSWEVLFAKREETYLAMVCNTGWSMQSVGFVGTSDGWQDLHQHHQMKWSYDCAEDGNVALTAQVKTDDQEKEQTFTIAIGFGLSPEEAANHATGGLIAGFDQAKEKYVSAWQEWQKCVQLPDGKKNKDALYSISAAVLRMHTSKSFPGGLLASLSIPWGDTKGDENVSGYHMVWPRDLAETGSGLLAIHAIDDALEVINYLMTTQEADGHWPQNMWLSGKPYWTAKQLDETALPILFIDLCLQKEVIPADKVTFCWQRIRRAAGFLIRSGLITEQERWEEQEGLSVYTMSTVVAALLVTARMADKNEEPQLASYLRETADSWNESIEYWTYAGQTALAKKYEVDGYYLRINSSKTPAADLTDETIKLKNNPPEEAVMPIVDLVSVDALSLVRFGLRAADDPRILNTLKVIDGEIRVETKNGSCWYRYNNDGYGEHADGSAYDGTGIGRAWPLLTGERAHYELAAGQKKEARKLMKDMQQFAFHGMMPEQVWESEDIPEKELFNGQHSGAAMPLAWAHAEYLKLVRSIHEGQIFDQPSCTYERYVRDGQQARHINWRKDLPRTSMPAGKILRVELTAPAKIRWAINDGDDSGQVSTSDSSMGIHFADIPTDQAWKGMLKVKVAADEPWSFEVTIG